MKQFYSGSFYVAESRNSEYAAKIANVEQFIKMLPEGYYSNIGQKYSSLSSGQKQMYNLLNL
jgi:ABC-type protease/lipase transport system fused ATPase/permease subunit